MAKNVTLYSVFVASPTDVAVEREIVSKVVNELNLTIANILNIKLELKRWETDVYPDMGEGSQPVINRQINDDYDIFVGILWSKFGTPTKEAGSGTEEEFNRSYSKWKETKGAIKIMFYFKMESIPFRNINTKQIDLINQFKDSISDKELYWEFEDSNSFENFFRIHLNKAITDLVTKPVNQSLATSKKFEFPNPEEEIEELGLFESIGLVQSKFEDCRATLQNISRYLNELTQRFEERARQIQRLTSSANNVRIREQQRIIDDTADDMINFVNRTNIEIPIFKEKYEEGFKAFANAYSISYSTNLLKEQELEDIRSSISSLKEGIVSGNEGMNSFYVAVKDSPTYTTAFGKAKKQILKTIENILKEFAAAFELVEQFEITTKGKE